MRSSLAKRQAQDDYILPSTKHLRIKLDQKDSVNAEYENDEALTNANKADRTCHHMNILLIYQWDSFPHLE
jgi:hypothetical protein